MSTVQMRRVKAGGAAAFCCDKKKTGNIHDCYRNNVTVIGMQEVLRMKHFLSIAQCVLYMFSL